MSRRLLAVLALTTLAPVLAAAREPSCPAAGGERVLMFRTVEDPSFPPDRSFCATAPFTTTVFLGASVWSYAVNPFDGAVVKDSVRQVGTATGCAGIPSIAALAPFATPPKFMLRVELKEGVYVGYGHCTVTSDAVPQENVFLTGCTLEVIDAPEGTLGGIFSSASVFNPYRIPGLETGSYWTLRLYRK